MVEVFTLPINITLFCICLIYGLSTLITYIKEKGKKEKFTLYLSILFLVLAISSLIYMLFLIDFLIKGVLIIEGNLLLGLSQYVGITASLFALSFGLELGKTIGDISTTRPKRIGIVLWLIISVMFIPHLVGILFGFNLFGMMMPLIPSTYLLMIMSIFLLTTFAYGIPAVQFNKLRKIVPRKNRQIIRILLAYIFWIISFIFISVAGLLEYELNSTLEGFISILDIIGYILQICSLSLFFLGIYLPKIRKK